ncbi:MAG: DUF1570 domain-containing protein [Planctomycetota bacterium]|nr:DUF1570 domain-containing protein [Planctomycetaceae bacterium]MDQ3330135.1 DUF1570 domain-containing protein [Planctomycetota bacterium]
MPFRTIAAAVLGTLIPVFDCAAGVPLIELKTSNGAYRGRVVAKDDETALLIDRDGVARGVPLRDVTEFVVAEKDFKPLSAVDLRDRLRRLVGGDADVTATPHYVVAGRSSAARAVAEALEEVHNGYRWFCSTRRLKLSDPEFPLVAIVMPNRATFDAYCTAEGMSPNPSLQGYYRETTNRFVCYESGGSRSDSLAGVRDTLVHEAIHQLAFNTGLHVRMGDSPTWVVEGLATTLEPESVRRPLRSDVKPLDRTNPERLETYLAAVDRKRQVRAFDLVSSDQPFRSSALDAYATAWAMSFYLLETRPADYAKYLRTLSARSPLAEATADERNRDFRAAFGDIDPQQLDAEMTRFLRRVAAGAQR